MKKALLSLLLVTVFAACQTAPKPAVPVQPAAPRAAAAAADRFWPADGVFPVPGRTSSWRGFRAKNVERRTLFAQDAAADQNGIVFVGDSITEGWKMLDQDFAVLGVKVVDRGIGGDTTPNLVYRLEDDVLSLHPRALVILIGTNDLGEHTTPEQVASNLRELLARIRAEYPTIPIAWCLVMPRGENGYADRIRELNARIAQLVEADPQITVCDTFTPLALPDGKSNPDDFMPDRLHLISAGYAAWRTALLPILSRWNLKPAVANP